MGSVSPTTVRLFDIHHSEFEGGGFDEESSYNEAAGFVPFGHDFEEIESHRMNSTNQDSPGN
jgi:hypothetical protein